MTQENQPDLTETTDLTLNSDELLRAIINYAKPKNSEINITLFVQGTIISGVLISNEEYFESFKQSGKIDFGKELQNYRKHESIMKLLDDQIKSSSTESPDNQEEVHRSTDIEYIHLKNAKVHSVNIPNSESFYWRGRLSSIDGFSLL